MMTVLMMMIIIITIFWPTSTQHKATCMEIKLSKHNDHDGVSHDMASNYYYYYYYDETSTVMKVYRV